MDALDLIAQFKEAVVLAKCKLLQLRLERADQGAQIAVVVLQVPDRVDVDRRKLMGWDREKAGADWRF